MKSYMVKDQISGTVVNEINKTRILSEINNIKIQDEALENALKETDKVREFIGTLEKILGSSKTKHGEIAEQVEVGVRRAKSILNGETPNATFDGVGRTAPEDYVINGLDVQSKFINGYNNNLKAVLDHMEKYENFGKDGSYYHIPKDSYESIEKVMNGEHVEGLKESTRKAIKEKIAEIERQSGKDFSDVVKPGISDYKDIQTGKVSETLDSHDKELKRENSEKKNIIKRDHRPNLKEGLKATGIAAAVGVSISLGTGKIIKLEIKKALDKLNAEYIKIVKSITEEFEKLGKLTEIAFDLTNNINLLDSSVNLAKAYNVKEEKIIKSISELDAYMMI